MPWCEECAKYWTPNAMNDDGACPRCGAVVEDQRGGDLGAVGEHVAGRIESHRDSGVGNVPRHSARPTDNGELAAGDGDEIVERYRLELVVGDYLIGAGDLTTLGHGRPAGSVLGRAEYDDADAGRADGDRVGGDEDGIAGGKSGEGEPGRRRERT